MSGPFVCSETANSHSALDFCGRARKSHRCVSLLACLPCVIFSRRQLSATQFNPIQPQRIEIFGFRLVLHSVDWHTPFSAPPHHTTQADEGAVWGLLTDVYKAYKGVFSDTDAHTPSNRYGQGTEAPLDACAHGRKCLCSDKAIMRSLRNRGGQH